MSQLDDRAADLPISAKVKSEAVVPASLQAKVDNAVSDPTDKLERSIAKGPKSSDSGPSSSGNIAKRKQSKIRIASDEEESEEEPLSKRSKISMKNEDDSPMKEPETLLKFDSPKRFVPNGNSTTTTNISDSSAEKLSRNSKEAAARRASGHKQDPGVSHNNDPNKADVPTKRKTTSIPKSVSPAVPQRSRKKVVKEESDSSSDEPLKKPPTKRKPASSRASASKSLKQGSSELSENSSDDEQPLKKAVKSQSTSKTPKVRKVAASQTASVAKKIDGKKTKATVKKEGSDDEDGDEQYKWWEQEKEDNSVKWTTLEHNGVVFPDPYKRLPKDVRMKYDGRPLDLTSEAEEVAGFFGALIETDHAQNPVFVKNFFEDFQNVCKDSGMKKETIPKDYKKCDFRPMYEYFEAKKEEKKAMTKDEKKKIKEDKDKFEEKYKEAVVDGRKEKIGNFRIEPPGLFRGRGAHPKTGRLKSRVQPEQVTINIGENVPVPAPPEGHKWAEVRHDNTVTWLATWNENINNNVKYVMMAAGSSFKGQSDLKKYEKARTLKGCIKDIRKKYEAELSDKVMETRQRATAMYFIDKFALRAGNEKGEDEADTVGCCSLRLEHVSLKQPQTVIFDFLGKDSIRYYNEVTVDQRVFKNLMIFKKGKKDEDMIFDRLNTGKLNKHLTELMPGLSAKVFRTFNASFTFQEQLKQTDANASVADKVLAYNRANREVAILCNHQRTVSKTHDAAMEKIEDKVKEQKYQKMRLRRAMVDIDPKLAKKKPSLLAYESELDDEWIAEHHDVLYNREVDKIKKKFERENEKLVSNDEKALTKDVLKERLQAAEELKSQLKQEKKTGKVIAKSGQTVEKLEVQVQKLEERIAVTKTQMIDKDENKTTALGTSKINYIDPRLTFAWCAKYSVPIEKMFTKTLREKFLWAAETPADWVF
ncbi:protein of unknown function [Taphrina deformans PYCC 5710]|uniref:DNA topoisomerase I n=1 Tax=Taphrina deformans (strain PYCC 5710 / ATCC 11124 / CBS 356.35 / IMI 108563 / JCM 9778 / NBRC 8474) TaxID=1097556 RepID=R4XH22_TAPDE|nr:protein of unknown function [Taphrina deformans PYCC 5710]|eukprot:CCG83818.1 protein of unknown function [Taphrina deformans PYCC 5710]